MRSIFAQLVGLIIASLIFLVLFPPSSGLLGVLWVIGFFVSYAIIGGMIDSLLENIFNSPEKQREKIIKEVLSKPPATDTIPPVKTINNITEPKYYTAEELAKDFSRGRVVDSRISPSLKGYYDAIKSQNEKARIINTTGYRKITPEQIRAMDWREFESFVANMFVEQGYKTTLTPETQDGGKDVIAEKDGITYYIECKHWKNSNNIGRELLQKLVGAAVANGVTHVIFIATCQYNSNAIAYANQVNKNGFDIRLWGIEDILKFIPSIPSIFIYNETTDKYSHIVKPIATPQDHENCININNDIDSLIHTSRLVASNGIWSYIDFIGETLNENTDCVKIKIHEIIKYKRNNKLITMDKDYYITYNKHTGKRLDINIDSKDVSVVDC